MSTACPKPFFTSCSSGFKDTEYSEGCQAILKKFNIYKISVASFSFM